VSDDARTRTLDLPAPDSESGDARPSIVVTVVDGPDRGTTVTVPSSRAMVGRAETADVRLSDPTVSQFHVELGTRHDGVLVSDLGSRNGTRAGPVAIRVAQVPFGAELALGSSRVRLDVGSAAPAERSRASSFGALVGASPVMRELYALLERVARTDLAVLLEGETGTGKELAARALHETGRRSRAPFVVVDCTSIPPSLAESVLFGHERGAFTGATERRSGLFEAADRGTLFLDEVGELARDLQPKLLRVLERREVVPVGATKPRPVDVRIVSATWRDIRAMVNDGTFREDLYYRLAQARIRLPSLQERREDIKPLVQHFLTQIPWDVTAARAIEHDALAAMASRAFPGNIRELKATVERAAMIAEGATITTADLAFDRLLAAERGRAAPATSAIPAQRGPSALPPPPSADGPIEKFKEAKRTLIDEFEKDYLARFLARAGTNVSRAASLAGIERQSLRDLLKRHGLRGDD